MIKKLVSIFLFFSNACFAIDQLPYCCPVSAINYVKKYLSEKPVIVECGAYDGNETRIMAKLWPKGTIHTFEPLPSIFQILKKNTNSFPNVRAYQLALGDFCGKSIFYVSKLNGETVASSSILPPQEHIKLNPTRFDDTIQVNILDLDTWASINGVDHIDFMWLDMQGYELNMLQVSELAKKAKVIYTEVEFIPLYEGQYLYQDVLNWMTENGFEMVAKDFYEKKDFGNVVFVKKTTK